MNFKDKVNYAKKLLTDTFGKPIYSADWAFAAWNVKNDIFITEEEDGGFLLVKRDMELYNGDSDYVFDELYSSQSVNKVIAEAKKYMKKQFKGLGNITPSNYFDTITPIVGKLPEWAKLMHQTALDLKAADIDPFTELDAEDSEMMQNLLAEANKIAMASETKPEKPKAEPKPAFKRTKPKAGVKKAVTKAKSNAKPKAKIVEMNDKNLARYKTVFSSIKKDEKGYFIPSSAASEQYVVKQFKAKGIKVIVTEFVNDLTDLYDIYFKEATASQTAKKPVASSKKPAAKKAAKAPSAAQVAAREKFAKMAKDKAKAKGGKAAKPTKTKAVSTKSQKAVKQVAKKAATKKPAARSQKPAAKATAPIVRNIKSIEIQHITRYLNLDGKNKTAKAVLNLAKEVKSSVAAKEYIQHTSILEEIHSKLTKAYNAITKAGVHTVDFIIDKDFKAKLTAILKNVKVRVQTNVLAGTKEMLEDATGDDWDDDDVDDFLLAAGDNWDDDDNDELSGTKKKSLKSTSVNHQSKIKNQKSLSGVTSAADMLNQNYKTIDLGPYKKYFGEVAHNFDMMLHGEPGAGKTYFLLTFANWYANNIGDVLFVSDEEYGTVTLQNKIAETKSNSPNLYFSKSINGVNVSDYALVILDSINSIGITLEQYIALRSKNPNTAMIGILQKTKDGNFRGGKEWEHEFEIAGELIFNDKNQRCIKTYKNRYGILKEQKI